jgi:ribosome-associated protein
LSIIIKSKKDEKKTPISIEYTEMRDGKESMMIKINKTLSIPDSEYEEKFIQASGPGGQNVNKVATAVQLRFALKESAVLPDSTKDRIRSLVPGSVTKEGDLLIESSTFRTQDKNRVAARERLADIIRKGLKTPRKRKRTKPTRASRERRLNRKKTHSRKKKLRKPPKYNGEY